MVNECIVKAPAKINLSLDVVGRRADGYHLLETVMQTIGLYDEVRIRVFGTGQPDVLPSIVISCSSADVPDDARNTAYKAAAAFAGRLMSGRSGRNIAVSAIEIAVRKGIPQEAGLAGGSADAAGTLYGLNRLFGDVLTREELMMLAAGIGADVPFCLAGGTALCTGIGEIIRPAADFGGRAVLLVKPDFGISTPWAFRQLDAGSIRQRPDTQAVLEALSDGDAGRLFRRTANVLESVAFPAHPVLGDIKDALTAMPGCKGSLMSGSGATMFAVFDGFPDAQAAADRMRSRYNGNRFFIEVTQTVSAGPAFSSGNSGLIGLEDKV